MKTQFTPIAMRCTEENWNSISHKIKNAGIRENVWGLDDRQCYLCNNWSESKKDGKIYIGNHSNDHSNFSIVSKVYETWDETTFLKACGIEVDTYTVSKDFILEAHESACTTFKTKIENQFPELFPKVELEVGKWLKDDTNPKWLIYNDGNNIYGFDINGNWVYRSNESYALQSQDRLATKEEVETALTKLLKEKYKKGDRVRCLYDNQVVTIKNMKIDFCFNRNRVYVNQVENNDTVKIFDKGKFAEIISEPIELSLDEIAEKFGVDVSLIKIKK